MKWFILLILAIFVGIVMFYKIEKPTQKKAVIATPKISPTPVKLRAKTIFNLVNKHRESNGVKVLQWNDLMCPFAQKRAFELQDNYSHDGYTNTPIPYRFVNAAENIGGALSEKLVVESWINSQSHNEAMLNKRFTDTCIAIGESNYVVQHFASF